MHFFQRKTCAQFLYSINGSLWGVGRRFVLVLGREVRRTKLPVSFIVKNPGRQGILSQSAKAIHIPPTHLLFTL